MYLFTTEEEADDLKLASDVAYDPDDLEIAERYLSMSRQIAQIQFVVDNPAAIG